MSHLLFSLILIQFDANGYDETTGRTPIMEAAIRGSVEIIKLLFRHHGSAYRIDRKGNTALHLAAGRGQLGAVAMLIQQDLPLNIPNKDNYTPLMLAAKNGHHKVINLLIQNRAAVHRLGPNNETALTLACSRVCVLILPLHFFFFPKETLQGSQVPLKEEV